MLRLVSDHPIAAALLLACALVLAARAYFRATKDFLERFDELPERRFLSGAELLVLGFPATIESARLARLDARYKTASRVALGVALLVVATLAVQRAVLADEPLSRVGERIAEVRGELELELRSPERSSRSSERAEELANRLKSLLERFDARAAEAREPLDGALLDLRRRCAALLANARGSYASTLDLVSERELAEEARATDARVERELDLALLRARALCGLDRPERAVELYQRAVALRPERADLRLEAARALADAGRSDGAREMLERAIALDREALQGGEQPELARRLADSLALRASLARRDGRPSEALRDLDEALALRARLADARPELAPTDERARALAQRGLALEELGRSREARGALDAAVALGERALAGSDEREARERELELADALFDRARVASALGDRAAALADLERVVDARERALRAGRAELAPALARARAARASLRLEAGDDAALGELDAALGELRRCAAERADPTLDRAEARARLARARALARAGRGEEALRETATALALAEGASSGRASLAAEAHEQRAALFTASGDARAAVEELGAAIELREAELEPAEGGACPIELALAHARRGELYASLARSDRALADLDRAVQLARGDADALDPRRELALGFALRRRAECSRAAQRDAEASADLVDAIAALEGVEGGAQELALARAALAELESTGGAASDPRARGATAPALVPPSRPDALGSPASAPHEPPPAPNGASPAGGDGTPRSIAGGGAKERDRIDRRGEAAASPERAATQDASLARAAAVAEEDGSADSGALENDAVRALELERRARELDERGDAEASASALAEAIALRERLFAAEVSPERADALARDLAERARSAGGSDVAFADWTRALELVDGGAEGARDLAAEAHRARAELLVGRGDLDAALDDARAAVDLLRELARGGDGSPRELARALELRGRIHARAEHFAPAEADLAEAIDLRRALARPGATGADELALAKALADRALCAYDRRDGARALRDLDEAIGIVAPLVELEGRDDLEPELARLRALRAKVLGGSR